MSVAKKISLSCPRLLIVDDEPHIRQTLEAIFSDEGFDVLGVSSGEEALTLLGTQQFSAIILDIWMSGLDGVETLKVIKQVYPTVPVIMMSGHASVATAMESIKFGAADFVEKPLVLESTVRAVRQAIEKAESDGLKDGESANAAGSNSRVIPLFSARPQVDDSVEIDPTPFLNQAIGRGRRVPQRTLKKSILLYGQGLHSGKKSGLSLEPLPPNSGIHFAGVGARQAIPAHIQSVASTGFATTLSRGESSVSTVEHLMSALCAFGITNLLIKCNGEVPVLDGSSIEFCKLFLETGINEQPGDWFDWKVTKPIEFARSEQEWIRVEPADELTISYTLRYPAPVGEQRYTFTMDDPYGEPRRYQEEIASCRTFGFVKDIRALQAKGLALGGRFDNHVLVGDSGPINTTLRYPDEFVRHKILDVIGDLYLLGRRLQGKVSAQMTGHGDNVEILRRVAQAG